MEKRLPKILWITVSAVCMLKCPACVHGMDRGHKRIEDIFGTEVRFWTLDMFRQIVDEAAFFDPLVSLTGPGETLLNPEIHEMLEYASTQKGLRLQFDTNAQKMDVERLANVGPIHVTFSLDGYDQPGYAAYRRNGSFQTVRDNLENFVAITKNISKERRPRVTCKYIVHRFNEDQVEAARNWVATLPDVEFMPVPFFLPPEDYKWFVDTHNSLATSEQYEYWTPRNRDYSMYCLDSKRDLYQLKTMLLPCDCKCELVENDMYININGSVYPCGAAIHAAENDPIYFGNVFKLGVVEAYNSERANNFRQEYYAKKGEISMCRECPHNRVRSFCRTADIDVGQASVLTHAAEV